MLWYNFKAGENNVNCLPKNSFFVSWNGNEIFSKKKAIALANLGFLCDEINKMEY